MNSEFPKLEKAKKILKRSFHIWSALPEGDLFLRLIDPDGELPELTFRGKTVKDAIELAWEYAENEKKAWKVIEEENKEEKVEEEVSSSEEEKEEDKEKQDSTEKNEEEGIEEGSTEDN